MNNLASTYKAQRRLKEAYELGLQVLEGRKRVLAHEHPDTLTSMDHLSITYCLQGQLTEAIELGEYAMEARKRVLGPEHQDTLDSETNMTMILIKGGRSSIRG